MSPVFIIPICPKCHVEIHSDEGSHDHGGITYDAVDVQVRLDEPHFGQLVANACRDAERAHEEAQARRAADLAELMEMEAEWRQTAPREQVEAFDAALATRAMHSRTLAHAMRVTWSEPSVKHALASPSPLFASPEDIERHAEELRRLRREEAQRVIDAFEAKGPAVISFSALLSARRKLAELS